MTGKLDVGDRRQANAILAAQHYLGPTRSGLVYHDAEGVCVFNAPTSRRLPHDRWLELTRWCLTGGKNAGSRQWATVSRWLRRVRPEITTVVSYSDPSVGHTGALYRACNWLWAPTWHRLREPPTGNGTWTAGKRQSTKDRWVFCLAPDAEREQLLRINDESLVRRFAYAQFRERLGGDYKRWRAEQIG